MNEIGIKIKEVRKRKGLSQEELADLAKVNLRTIQRIENNDNEPRGKTLLLICEVLDINAEGILDYGKKSDKHYMMYFQLSVLSFLIIPTGNIIIPFILWMTKKDKIIGLKNAGANLLNFQIIWTFIAFTILIIAAFLKVIHLEIGPGNFILSIYIFAVLYPLNIILPIIFAIKIKKGKTGKFYPNIIRLIK
ncbi:helix-turn-helix domain-containing protein [Flavivirga spongiicola]|uniref:Helix-turn-helix domain-containing protein n=1 Tax=Flavivirga spongiicola TaxID=421621 RepID=A0ABU7Y0E2_9FLAO|nr:helix-turn-helix domain-containing protein [Flavivirga sp. MEBiC05379]MDO5981170.1 helix-turn-helix domain-containing protein [Flavivirga sp. MEBiC05379]